MISECQSEFSLLSHHLWWRVMHPLSFDATMRDASSWAMDASDPVC